MCDCLQLNLLSSLEKVFLDENVDAETCPDILSGLRGETVSFQAAFCLQKEWGRVPVKVEIASPIQSCIHVRLVKSVPVECAANAHADKHYLRLTPGLYPDLLREIPENGEIWPALRRWYSLWIDVELTDEVKPGVYPVAVTLTADGERHTKTVQIRAIGAALPEQKLMHTEWMHADCLADYYRVPVFSEAHWKIIKNFIREAVKRGCNMMMVPLFTSPLDVGFGGSRTTTQLVRVSLEDRNYRFDFRDVRRWIELCQSCGIRYFEMSHLFSQWGAKYAPVIYADVGGTEKRIFGFDTPAVGEYTRFLNAFLPELTAKLREWGIDQNTYFHISDEPREEDLETYAAARKSLGDMLDGFHTFDALSSYEFYRHGLIDKPVPGNNEIQEFLDHGLTDMWTYYCTGQCVDVSNRFMSMPSYRNRIIGVQLYKFQIIGFLHWGFNFYNSQFSIKHINPYQVTDAGGAFPAGDPFLVYPGEGGKPEESIRIMVFQEALQDLRALELLEQLTDREHVLSLIEEGLEQPLSFTIYPHNPEYLLQLRKRVNMEIEECIHQ